MPSAILTSALKTAKTNALNSTIPQLLIKLQSAEDSIAALDLSQSQPDEAREIISTERANRYKEAFNQYLQILFDASAQNEANAITSYLSSSAYVTGSGNIICL